MKWVMGGICVELGMLEMRIKRCSVGGVKMEVESWD